MTISKETFFEILAFLSKFKGLEILLNDDIKAELWKDYNYEGF